MRHDGPPRCPGFRLPNTYADLADLNADLALLNADLADPSAELDGLPETGKLSHVESRGAAFPPSNGNPARYLAKSMGSHDNSRMLRHAVAGFDFETGHRQANAYAVPHGTQPRERQEATWWTSRR
ncbi:hypothetical protein BAY61_18990 [Prauserella marina]|nr:hypothetical protein BAY61_18990 [Prauserella marina]